MTAVRLLPTHNNYNKITKISLILIFQNYNHIIARHHTKSTKNQ